MKTVTLSALMLAGFVTVGCDKNRDSGAYQSSPTPTNSNVSPGANAGATPNSVGSSGTGRAGAGGEPTGVTAPAGAPRATASGGNPTTAPTDSGPVRNAGPTGNTTPGANNGNRSGTIDTSTGDRNNSSVERGTAR